MFLAVLRLRAVQAAFLWQNNLEQLVPYTPRLDKGGFQW